MATDLLAGAAWTCAAVPPGLAATPEEVDALAVDWRPAAVPGTAAGAMRDAGRPDAVDCDYDGEDWWFRCRFPGSTVPSASTVEQYKGPWLLRMEGVATVADVWLNGIHLHHGENMFTSTEVPVVGLAEDNELVIRCHALAPLLAAKRPRPRWKTGLARHQNLRWFRTTLLGRQPGWVVTPAPVGPWRPVRLLSVPAIRVTARHVVAECDGGDGVVGLSVRLAGPGAVVEEGGTVAVEVGETRALLPGRMEGVELLVEGHVRVPDVRRWWPRTHGPQHRYPVTVRVGDHGVDLGAIGFRTVAVDRSDGGFRLLVNDVPVFCRGACWFPPDPVSFVSDDEELRATFDLVAAADMNMVRLPGGAVYEDERFWDQCDELGILVWQDCMLGYLDPPDDAEFVTALSAELGEVFGALGGRPSLAVVCGGQEIEEQAVMFGLPRERWGSALLTDTVAKLVEDLLPGVPYVASSPTGGDPPIRADEGTCHYFGVGTYLRPLDDLRRAGVRFMSEGLAFGVPPEPRTVEEVCGGAVKVGHDPGWKQAVHHDTGRALDLDDVREFYVRELFDVDPLLLRPLDPERALDLGRAATAEIMAAAFSEWRRPGSSCDGGLTIGLRDLRAGAGWGLIDALGRPKAPWYALRRVFQPVALLVTDEGVNGLRLHLVNDAAEPFTGLVRLALVARGELAVDRGERAVEVPARAGLELDAGSLLEGFRDVSYAYRFGPPPYDAVVATLVGDTGSAVSEVVHLPAGQLRQVEADIGLNARMRQQDGRWTVTVTTRRFAQWVVLDVPGFRPEDSWFHLPPGGERVVALLPEARLPEQGGGRRPSGEVRALNLQGSARIELAEPDRGSAEVGA